MITLCLITHDGVRFEQGARWSDRFDGPAGCVLALRDSPHDLIEGWLHSGALGVLRLQPVRFADRDAWGLILTPVQTAILMGRA